MNRHHRHTLHRRLGMTLLELTIAVGMLSVLLVTAVQMLRVLSTQQLAAERRLVALQTLQALAEQTTNTPWENVTAESLERMSVPAGVADYLPGSTLTSQLNDEPQPVPAKRVTLELTWRAPNGQQAAPIRLTTWVFEEASPTTSSADE